MREELGIAIIGCGSISANHLEALQNLGRKEGGVRLVATADPEENRAEQYASEYGAEFHYKDYKEVLANPAVDAVILALPNYLHAPITIEAAQAGKHIMVEKPMANNFEEANSMVAAADRANVKLMVAQIRRHIRALYTAWEMIDEIGKPLSASYLSLTRQINLAHWTRTKKMSGHLVFSALASHTIDYLLWLFKRTKKPVRVYAEGYSNIPEAEGIDEASVIIGFDDGAFATTNLSMNNRTPRIEKVIVIGTEGSMHMEHTYLPSEGSAKFGGVFSKLIFNERLIWEGIEEVWTLQMKEFVACICEDRPSLSDGRDARYVLPIIEAADLSATRHEVIWL